MPWRANNTEDIEAVERLVAFNIGVFSDPVYNTGDWPQILKDTLPPDYLPRFTEEESKDILGWYLSILGNENIQLAFRHRGLFRNRRVSDVLERCASRRPLRVRQ